MKYITPKLNTERLILKKGNFEDYAKVYEYDFLKLRGINEEISLVKQNIEDIKGFDTYAETNDGVFDWIVYLKNESIPIANIIADRENKELNSIEIAFNMHPKYWNKGYMTEAIIEVLKFLFEYGFDNVICGYSEGNIKSKNIGEKLGFEFLNKIDNAWFKNGIPITDYKTIMSKEKFKELYINKQR